MSNRSATSVDKEIGDIIRDYRKYSGMSQVNLAACIGVSYQQVQKYENGTTKVTVSRLKSICRALSIHPSVFF